MVGNDARNGQSLSVGAIGSHGKEVGGKSIDVARSDNEEDRLSGGRPCRKGA